jgi:hypothetical protein
MKKTPKHPIYLVNFKVFRSKTSYLPEDVKIILLNKTSFIRNAIVNFMLSYLSKQQIINKLIYN